MNKFWKWLLGFNEEESQGKGNDRDRKSHSENSADGSREAEEGNAHSGPDGYDGGEYEGR